MDTEKNLEHLLKVPFKTTAAVGFLQPSNDFLFVTLQVHILAELLLLHENAFALLDTKGLLGSG